MFQIIGIIVLFAMVFGSFIMGGGKMAVILNALPHELMAIGGAGVAAFLISNSMTVIKGVGGGVGKAFVGPKWKASDYRDLLSLLFLLTKTMKSKGVIALESHIEKPGESTIFARYPRLTKDHFAIDFICDTLRMMTMNLEDPHQVEDAMELQLDKHHHEALAPAAATSRRRPSRASWRWKRPSPPSRPTPRRASPSKPGVVLANAPGPVEKCVRIEP